MARGLWVGFLAVLFSTSSIASTSPTLASLCRLAIAAHGPIPKSVERYFAQNFLVPDAFDGDKHNLWDNWGAWDARYRIYHRYSQTAGTHLGLSSLDKSAHNEAAIRHFVSADGKTWYHVGVVLEKKSPDELAYWSGKLVIHEGFYYLFHTRGESSGRNQHIALSISKDGHRFSKSEPILKPEIKWNYAFEDSDGAIPAWRDPEVFWHNTLNCWVMVFATKAKQAGRVGPGFGLATSIDLMKWNLLPAMTPNLPEWLQVSGVQLELPNIDPRSGQVRLYASYSVPGDGSASGQLGTLYWDVKLLGDSLESPKILYNDARFYGFSLLAGTALLFSTDVHEMPYRMASVPIPE
ncbi:MAG: hypothetical protein KDD51_05790 [Bdellovibrionales bacterium]|nr:hypothetical protein [Bdellovibrionales bacterium]